MHVVLVTTSYPSIDPDGRAAAGSFVADFALALAEEVKVSVVAPGRTGHVNCQENLCVHFFSVPFQPLSLLSPSDPRHYPAIVRTLLAGHRALDDLTRKEATDHILALWSLPSGYWAHRVHLRRGIPYSTWSLGSDIWSLGKIPLARSLLAKVLRDSRYRFADGYLLSEDVKRISGKNCRFLPSSRDLPDCASRELERDPPYRLAFLGRWHRNKGIDILLESLRLLDDSDWERIDHVRICGGGPLNGRVHREVEKLSAHHRPVTVSGYMDKREASELLCWADYVIIPSRIESIPVIFSDAMKCGCPVITTPVGDLPRLIHEFDVGVCASAVQPDTLRSAIASAIRRNPKEYTARLKQAAAVFNSKASATSFLSYLNRNDTVL